MRDEERGDRIGSRALPAPDSQRLEDRRLVGRRGTGRAERPQQLGQQRRGTLRVADEHEVLACAREPDVQDTPLLLEVVAQPVRHEPGVQPDDHHHVPLAALDAVDRRERDARRRPARRRRACRAVAFGARAVQPVGEPAGQQARVGLQGSEVAERREVVPMARALRPAATPVEGVERQAEADVVADRGDDGGAARTRPDEPREQREVVDVAAQRHAMLGVDRGDAASDPVERRGCAGCDDTAQPARGPAQRVVEVRCADAVGVRRDPQVGERGAQARAGEDLGADVRADGDARLHQRQLWGEQRRTDTGEHRAVVG